MFMERRTLAGEPEEVESVEDRTLGREGIGVRIYRPKAKPGNRADALRAGLVYFHGGGWILGNLDTIDVPCRTLANASGRVLVSVDYRRAPEHKFPAALEDGFAATRETMKAAQEIGVDPARIGVGGDSAGGTLAAGVCLLARDLDRGLDPNRRSERLPRPLDCQLLIYPALDSACDSPSFDEFAEGFGLAAETMRYFWSQYLPDARPIRDPLASPLQADDLSALPGALIATAEYDVLRDEGEAYADKLRQAGVAVESIRFDGLIHGFLTLAGAIDRAQAASREIGAKLAESFGDRASARRRLVENESMIERSKDHS